MRLQKHLEKLSGVIQAYGLQLETTAPRTKIVWHKWGFECIDTRRRQYLLDKRNERMTKKAAKLARQAGAR